MVKLTVVPPTEPSPKEKIFERLKRIPRPDGMLQCNRCGSRGSMTLVAGAFIKNGRKQGGTMIKKDVCVECWKRNIHSPMIPEIKPVKDKK